MEKILIVRLGAMGDILHALPAVTGIRAALPEATLGWLIEERWSELLTAHTQKPVPDALSPEKPVVDLIHTVNTKRWRKNLLRSSAYAEIRGDLKRVRGVHYDMVLDFQGAIKSGIFGWLSAAKERMGFSETRESAARLFYSRRFARHGEHVIEQNYALCTQALQKVLAGRELALPAPQLPTDAVSESWAEAEIKRLGVGSFAIITPGGGWGAKQWPAARFGEVARALASHNLKTLVNSAPGEEELAETVMRSSHGNAVPLRCGVGQLIAITRRARLFIGGDTGPLHLAAALGIPVVALFGPTDPARTGPYGTRCLVLRHPASKTTFSHHKQPDEGLMSISAEEVIAAARQLLGSQND